MSYAEFHLSSEGNQRAPQSTRSHPVFELNETILPHAFNLKTLSLPLSFCNIKTASAIIQVDDPTQVNAFNRTETSVWNIIVPEGCYTLAGLAAELQSLFRGLDLITPDPVGSFGLVSWGGFVVAVGKENRLDFTVPSGFYGVTDLEIRVYWQDDLKLFANRVWDRDEYLSLPHSTLADTTTPSKHPWRLIPNFLYLHSNIMTGCKYGRQLRVQGGFASNTILAKIPIDPDYQWGEQIMPYTNNLDPCFMYANDSSFSHLEFWFTDETTGREIDFQNMSFSLTLALMF